MATHRLIVFTQPTEGKEDEYNRWYDEVHLGDVLETGEAAFGSTSRRVIRKCERFGEALDFSNAVTL